MQEIKVFVKPPQSGKTRGSIIEPIRATFDEFVHIVVIPPCLNSQVQITSRLLSEIDELDKSMISRFDTGAGMVKMETSWATAAYRVNTGKVKLVVVLFNKKGKESLKHLLNLTKRRASLYFDEIHSAVSGNNLKDFNDISDICADRDFPISGNTATVSLVCDARTRGTMVLEPMPIQSSYRGFDSLEIVPFESMDQEEMYRRIIAENPEGTTLMAHSGYFVFMHKESRDKFIEVLRQSGKHGVAVVVNGDGISAVDSRTKRGKKLKPDLELWQTIHKLRAKYAFIGVFGHTCMKESVTMQQCTPEINSVVDHMVYVSEGKCNTTRIQKVGRMFANDDNGNRRKLWITDRDLNRLKKSFEIEKILLEYRGSIGTSRAEEIYSERLAETQD